MGCGRNRTAQRREAAVPPDLADRVVERQNVCTENVMPSIASALIMASATCPSEWRWQSVVDDGCHHKPHTPGTPRGVKGGTAPSLGPSCGTPMTRYRGNSGYVAQMHLGRARTPTSCCVPTSRRCGDRSWSGSQDVNHGQKGALSDSNLTRPHRLQRNGRQGRGGRPRVWGNHIRGMLAGNGGFATC